MKSLKLKLLSTTAVPVLVGAGIAVGGTFMLGGQGHAMNLLAPQAKQLPLAKSRPGGFQLAACSPCAAKNPCNPCAAKNPCNPCAAKNPCNPCAGAATAGSSECFVPRLKTAALQNPCAAKNPCNPCAAKNPCNPCAAKNPCNPCAAKNPCNPCAAKNPCSPCGAGAAPELTAAEARAAYDCLMGDMKVAYAKSGLGAVANFTRWTSANAAPYQSATHGNRYVNNYVNSRAAYLYVKFEQAGKMPVGAVVAKDSFVAHGDGKVGVGPLFVMEKMKAGFSKETGDWRYTMVMPNGSKFGETKGKNAAGMKFCAECHSSVAEQDHLFFLPEEYRAKF